MRQSVYLAGSSLLVIVISAIAPAQEPSASDEEQLSVKYAIWNSSDCALGSRQKTIYQELRQADA